MRVQEVMTKSVKTVAPGTSLKVVAALLVDYGISGLPVCDEDGVVVGVVSEGDILVSRKRRREFTWRRHCRFAMAEGRSR